MTSTHQDHPQGEAQQDRRSRRFPIDRRGWVVLAAVLGIQLLLVLIAVAPQLSPRLSGTEITLRVGPVDPIDPFRGAYVDLSYPDLPDQSSTWDGDDPRGTAYVPLRQEGAVWVGGRVQRTQPDGLYLRCDDGSWRLECGIESWFVGQSVAAEIERSMRNEEALATIRVDRWGNATIVDLQPAG
ncbi:MAG: GDYXXLXY domain-containing protein [Dermatophilaceae bacterium]|nr:GDYXXLXY domain-containing protein [Intrasporangiaceae bacterium]